MNDVQAHTGVPLTLGIVRAFNNNVVVARDDMGRDYVLMGKGIGFRASAHDRIATSSVERVFTPADGESAERVVALLSELSPEQIELADEIARWARVELEVEFAESLVIALADHLAQALRNAESGTRVSVPLATEVVYAFPAEHAVAMRALELIRDRTGVLLPATEAAAIALHLVNAGYAAGDMTMTLQLTAVLSDAVLVVEKEFGTRIDASSVAVARFATHLRFLLNRLESQTQQDGTSSYMWAAAKASHPREHSSAVAIGHLLGARFGVAVTQDEELYLTLHVMRLLARTDSP